MQQGLSLSEIRIGDSASFSKTLTETDTYLYAGITADLNPAHINQSASEDTRFGGRIVHGMLSAGLISAVLGMQLPGPGTIYVGQELSFTAPVRFGDTITATVTAAEKIKERFLKLKTVCTNQEGEVVIEGYATVMPPRPAARPAPGAGANGEAGADAATTADAATAAGAGADADAGNTAGATKNAGAPDREAVAQEVR